MKYLREKFNIFYPRIKYTFKNLSVHGPNYLVRNDISFVYKFIYFIIYINVWIAAVASIYKYILSYQEDTIRFTTRTDYLDWNTTFPSVTVCEVANNDKILTDVRKLQSNTGNEDKMVLFVKDIAFFSGDCQSCSITEENFPISTKDFVNISSTFRSTCKELFVSCNWNDKPLNCCEHFNPIYTEYGLCYTMNNNQISDKHDSYYVSSSNHRKLGTLEILLSESYEAFLHSHEDVPYWNMEQDRRATVLYGTKGSMLFSIVDIVNEPEVAWTSPDVRQCRFSDELPTNFRGYRHYSYSVCIIQCRIEAQLELCNCTSHLLPNEYNHRYCDLEGLKCLTKHYGKLKKLKVPGVNGTGLSCKCLSSCTEPDYNIIYKKVSDQNKDLKAGIFKFILSNRPYERVTRQIARNALDLVVAMGNCFGLCFGGSLLSIVEVLYYLCFKQWKYTTVN